MKGSMETKLCKMHLHFLLLSVLLKDSRGWAHLPRGHLPLDQGHSATHSPRTSGQVGTMGHPQPG